MRKSILLLFVLTFIICGCSKAGDEIILTDTEPSVMEADDSASFETSVATDNSMETDTVITVYVCGAVKAPGVYELEKDSRINAAVEAAGGFSENADTEYVNLAARLLDGVKLQIPTLEETKNAVNTDIPSFDVLNESSVSTVDSRKGLININTADKEELKTLPGIGDGIAGRILEYRNQNGSFKSIEDIMNVTGIKSKLFSKIKDHISV